MSAIAYEETTPPCDSQQAILSTTLGAHTNTPFFLPTMNDRPTAKRQLDVTSSESDPLPAKRAKFTPTNTERLGVGKQTTGQAAKTTLQQPKPKHPKWLDTSFVQDFVDPVDPHLHPDSLVHTAVSEWLKSVGSDREKHCRSDSHLFHSDLFHSDGDPLKSPKTPLKGLKWNPVSRRLTKSAPEMGYTRDADGFAVPPTPSSGSRSTVPPTPTSTGSIASSAFNDDAPSSKSSGRSLVEDPLYRDTNLAANNIYIRPLYEQFPEHIAGLVDYVRRDRDSPGPSSDQIREDAGLNELWMGTGEPEVEDYFRDKIFPKPGPSDALKRSDRQPTAKRTVPTGSRFKISTPIPDMLYGYNRHGAFPQQQSQLMSMGTEMVATNQVQSLIYPFFVIEFKGDGGSMWVATNQCLGGAATCVSIAERLNDQLRHCSSDEIQPIDSAVFSVAINGSEARLYISWKYDELDYYMANVKSFLLQDAEHYIEFRKIVRNIIDWGKDKRLNEIRASLDKLLEESRKRTSETAKSRQPPSDGSATSGKKHKPSSSRRSSRSKQQQADKTCQDTHDTHQELSSEQQSVANIDYAPQTSGGPALSEYLNHENDQHDQSQTPLSFDYVVEPQGDFASDFDPHGHEAYSNHPRYSHGPEAHSNHPRYSHDHSSSSHRHQHNPDPDTSYAAAGSFPQASPVTAPAEKQLAASADDYWVWSDKHKNWYYLTEDGGLRVVPEAVMRKFSAKPGIFSFGYCVYLQYSIPPRILSNNQFVAGPLISQL